MIKGMRNKWMLIGFAITIGFLGILLFLHNQSELISNHQVYAAQASDIVIKNQYDDRVNTIHPDEKGEILLNIHNRKSGTDKMLIDLPKGLSLNEDKTKQANLKGNTSLVDGQDDKISIEKSEDTHTYKVYLEAKQLDKDDQIQVVSQGKDSVTASNIVKVK